MADNLAHRPKEPDAGRLDQDDDDEDEIDETGYKAVKDAVLFAIEVSPSMLQSPTATGGRKTDTDSPLMAALKAAYHLMQQRIIAAPKDLMGVLLYGTEASKFYNEDKETTGGWSFPHCYLLTDLDIPEADDVKTLKRLVESEDPEAQEVLKPTNDAVGMHTVLFCVNQIFQQKASNFSSRRLFLVTNNDDPHADNKAFRSQATVRAKDLYDLGVTIELFPISTPPREFDSSLFYNDIVYKTVPDDPEAIVYNPVSVADSDTSALKAGGTTDGIGLLQSLLLNIASKVTPKRALFSSVPLEIAPGLKISVKGYLLYKHQQPARSCYIYVEGEVPEIVKGRRALEVTQDGAYGQSMTREVQKAEIRKAYTFGGEKITFTEDEVKKLRDFGDPVIRIIGFKPLGKLPLWANTKNSTFLYPSEEAYIGSSRVYSALYQKLAKDQLFGLCWFVPRRNAVPVMAAMIPTLIDDSDKNLAGTSVTGAPQGLHIIPLPFADDIRQNPPVFRTPPVASDSLIDAMRPMIRKEPKFLNGTSTHTDLEQLNLPKGTYDPGRYANPSLQWHYRILQALALEEDVPKVPEDKTIPKYKQIDKRIGAEAIAWGRALETEYDQFAAENPDVAMTGAKRSIPSQSAGGRSGEAKKVKTEASQALSEGEMRKLFDKQKISSLTVAHLKEFCMAKSIPVAGKKADLVERIEGWFESK